MQEVEKYSLEEAHLRFAKQSHGETWEMLGKERRSQEDNLRMIRAAQTSLYHWLQVGTVLNEQRGEWLLARVYNVLGMVDLALLHAERCLRLTEANPEQMQDFDLAFAYEGIARAYALGGNPVEAKKYLQLAQVAGEAIVDPEDKEIFMGDLNGGEWYGAR